MKAWKANYPGEPEPPVKAPLNMVEGLGATRNLDLASKTETQLWLAKYDILIHSAASGAEVEAMDLAALYNSIRKTTTHLCGPELEGKGDDWAQGQSRFIHIFLHSASYYNYAV